VYYPKEEISPKTYEAYCHNVIDTPYKRHVPLKLEKCNKNRQPH